MMGYNVAMKSLASIQISPVNFCLQGLVNGGYLYGI